MVSCRLGLLQVEFGQHLLAHGKFLNLASHRHWKRLNKFDVAGDFVVCNLPATELLEFVRGCRDALPQPDPGTEFLAIARIWHAKDLYVQDLGVSIEKFFDLARIDVLATANDHILE